jgi:hypothetical protein
MPALSLNDFAKQELGYQPGTRIPAAEASKIRAAYQHYINKRTDASVAAERPAFTPTGVNATFPDGSSVPMLMTSANSAMPAPDRNTWKPDRVTANDGTVYLYDPNTGNGFPVRDLYTGTPIKAATKDTQDSVVAMQQAQLQQDIAKMQSAGAPWYRSSASYQQDIAAKQAQLNAMLNPASVLAGAPSPSAQPPAPTPQATPQATPVPTPDSAFLTSPMPSPTPEATPAPTPISMSSSDYQSKYGRAMKPGRYRTKSGAEVLITD